MKVYNTNVSEKKREMTIEKLAVMVAGGFEQMDKRFEQVDSKFKQVDKRFDHMESRLDGLELKISSASASWVHKFDRLHSWIEELDGRVNKIEDKMVGR